MIKWAKKTGLGLRFRWNAVNPYTWSSYLKAFLENDLCKVWKETNIWCRHKTRHTAQQTSRNSQLYRTSDNPTGPGLWDHLARHASELQMEKTVRNAMPTIEKVPFVSREKPGPHPFSKYSFSNITEKIGHIITCSQPVDLTNSILIFPFRGCNIATSKGFSLAFIRFPFQTTKVGNGNWAQFKPSLIPLHRFIDTGSPPHTGS